MYFPPMTSIHQITPGKIVKPGFCSDSCTEIV